MCIIHSIWSLSSFTLISFSNSIITLVSLIFPQMGVIDIGRKSAIDVGGLHLGKGRISEFLYASRNTLVLKVQFIISVKGVANSAANSLKPK